jgi:hypothetical protein
MCCICPCSLPSAGAPNPGRRHQASGGGKTIGQSVALAQALSERTVRQSKTDLVRNFIQASLNQSGLCGGISHSRRTLGP